MVGLTHATVKASLGSRTRAHSVSLGPRVARADTKSTPADGDGADAEPVALGALPP